jgi:large conductance mechanosensitive channel
MKGFRDFVLRGNVIDLAVGIVIGAAFTAVVTALVGSFVTPLIAAIGGKPDFGKLYFTLNGSKFAYGVFINAVLSFLLVAAVIYFLVVLPVNRIMARYFPKEDITSPKRDCPECLSSIPAEARRCAFCTAQVPAVPAPPAT